MYEHDNGYIKIFMHKLNKYGGGGDGGDSESIGEN